MIRLAIVDDEDSAQELLHAALMRFEEETGTQFEIEFFKNAIDFLEEYRPVDIVLMDVEMPLIDGLSAAEKLRRIDPKVALIFITNMAQYAIKGYAVDAIDYVLKPINYARFSALIKKTLRLIGQKPDKELTIKIASGVRLLYVSSIVYVEISGHLLYYHTETERIETWGTLREIEHELQGDHFVRCSHNCLVNLKYVAGVEKNTITLQTGGHLTVSAGKKKEFMERLKEYKR